MSALVRQGGPARSSRRLARPPRPSNPALLEVRKMGEKGPQSIQDVLDQLDSKHTSLTITNLALSEDDIIRLLARLDNRNVTRVEQGGLEKAIGLLDLVNCKVSAGGMRAILQYAQRDENLLHLEISDDQMEVLSDFEAAIDALNKSHINSFALKNVGFRPDMLSTLFTRLSSATLTILQLEDSYLGSTESKALAEYLASTASHHLTALYLERSFRKGEDIATIVDAIEKHNYRILHLDLEARPLGCVRYPDDEERQNLISAEIGRAQTLIDRNMRLAKRVRNAASIILPYARLLLNARPLIVDDPASSSPLPSAPPGILRLPTEVLLPILRHIPGDPSALSLGQFTRLMKHAGSRAELQQVVKKSQEGPKERRHFREGPPMSKRYEWLTSGGWDRWEQEGAPIGQ